MNLVLADKMTGLMCWHVKKIVRGPEVLKHCVCSFCQVYQYIYKYMYVYIYNPFPLILNTPRKHGLVGDSYIFRYIFVTIYGVFNVI